jgi:glucan 1,3-beta-glucosidase
VREVSDPEIGYRLEGCASNEGWCFRQAVGNSIPPTFFSYPGATSYVDPSEAPDGVGSELSQIQPNTTNGSAASAHARRSTVTTLFERSQKRSTFERYSHQQTLKQLRRLLRERGDDSETPSSISSDISTTQEAVSKGYLDGFETAKIFASHGMSRLGFSGQYIADSADALFLSDGLEDPYQGGFTDGWREGEGKVASFIVTWFASTSGS